MTQEAAVTEGRAGQAQGASQQLAPAKSEPAKLTELTEDEVKAIRALPFYQKDIAEAQRTLQKRLVEAERGLKEARSQLDAAQLDPEERQGLVNGSRVAEKLRGYYQRHGVPDDILGRARTLDAIELAGDSYIAAKGEGQAQTGAASEDQKTTEVVRRVLEQMGVKPTVTPGNTRTAQLRESGRPVTTPQSLDELRKVDTRYLTKQQLAEHKTRLQEAVAYEQTRAG